LVFCTWTDHGFIYLMVEIWASGHLNCFFNRLIRSFSVPIPMISVVIVR
jgi:hypothetical protein